MAAVSDWVSGARPRTLPMAVAPVVIGAAAAVAQYLGFRQAPGDPAGELTGQVGWLLAAVAGLALIVALALQVGVNYANDYSDGVRGTDDARVGPMRLTGSGAARAEHVKLAAFASFGVAAAAGLGIVMITSTWWMLAVGVACVLAAWWYTGGSRPYGYRGLGEVMVFIFFGLVATLGTAYVMVELGLQHGVVVEFPGAAVLGAVSHGLIASALLMANNIRDIPTDRDSGKLTLAVRLGQRSARRGYALMIGVAVVLPLVLVVQSPWYLLVLLCWPLTLPPVRTMVRRAPVARGPQLIPALQQTGMIGLAFAATYSAALLLG